jgi:hypothetical protein
MREDITTANKAIERYTSPAARLVRGTSRATGFAPLIADVGIKYNHPISRQAGDQVRRPRREENQPDNHPLWPAGAETQARARKQI